jgi:hypothetical protein
MFISSEKVIKVKIKTYVQNKNEEVGLLSLATKLLLSELNILLELADSVLQGCAGIIDLIDDKNVLANQVGHLQRAHVQPLRAGDLGTGDLLGVSAAQILVKGKADSLDGDVGVTGLLEKGSIGDLGSAF